MVEKTILTSKLAVSLFLMILAATALPAGTIYVDDDANGLNNGTSWADAYNYLQDALADANSSPKPVEIRVAQGIYKPDQDSNHPTGTGDRNATFCLKNSVALKGGYAGPRMSLSGADPNSRNIDLCKTILSGDLNGDDVDIGDPCALWNEPSRAENSYHVVTGSNTDANAVLDGFTITAGSANGSSDKHRCGAGIYNDSGNFIVRNCVLTKNSGYFGGGMYSDQGPPSVINCDFRKNVGDGLSSYDKCLTLANCKFTNNSAVFGGGCYNSARSLAVTDCIFNSNQSEGGGAICNVGAAILFRCTFMGNSSMHGGGGGMWNCDTYVMLISCIFEENSGESGGGIYNYEAGSSLTNCTFRKNHADWGGGIHNSGSDATITDCLFSQNTAYESGGGVSNHYSGLTACNCVFSGNSSGNTGGGAFNEAGLQPTLTGCTFTGNSAQKGNALACPPLLWYQGTVRLANCILWDGGDEIWTKESSTIMIAYSDVQGGWPGEGNIDVDPCFAELGYWDPNGTPDDPNDDFWIDGDYHLKSQAGRWNANEGRWTKDEVTSLCIDAGDPNSPIGLEPFPNGGIINMGAYGGTIEASKSYFGGPICETIVAGDINGDCKIDYQDLFFLSLNWLADNSPQ